MCLWEFLGISMLIRVFVWNVKYLLILWLPNKKSALDTTVGGIEPPNAFTQTGFLNQRADQQAQYCQLLFLSRRELDSNQQFAYANDISSVARKPFPHPRLFISVTSKNWTYISGSWIQCSSRWTIVTILELPRRVELRSSASQADVLAVVLWEHDCLWRLSGSSVNRTHMSYI